MFGIRKLLRQIMARLETIETSLENWYQAGAQSSNELSSDLKKLRSAANQHDMAIEDLLDGWEELRNDQQSENRVLSAALIEAGERERSQAAQRESALLQLSMTACDQIHGLCRTAEESGAEDWAHQLRLAESKLREASLPAGFQMIAEAGLPVDFRIHEVIEVQEAESPEQAHTVAEVYSCGYSYMGRIIRKAMIRAYREMGSGSAGDSRQNQEKEI